MKKLQLYLILYILFVYEHYIKDDDFDIYTKFGKFLLYPAWIVKNIIAIFYSIFCFPLVLFHWFYIWFEPIYEKMLLETGFYEKFMKL